MREQKWKIIGRGKYGWHAETGMSRGSGGTLEGYVKEAEPGSLVYDAMDADDEKFTHLVISGPMPNTDLGWDQVRRLPQEYRSAAASMLGPGGLSGDFAALAVACQDQEFSGLDYVGLGVFEALLRQVPGMRIGRVNDSGGVDWE